MFSLHHLLVPVEFNEVCREALTFASTLSRRFGASLTAVHVFPMTDAVAGLGHVQPVETRCTAEFEKLLAQSGDLSVDRVCLEGDPASEIVRFAHGKKCDMILMPTRGLGPVRRFLLGSVTAKVLHDADCAVWTGIHPEALTPDGEFSIRKVCAAVDLGLQTRATLRWAGDLADAFGASLVFVHVLPHTPGPDGYDHMERIAHDELQAMVGDLGLRGELHCVAGRVPDRIAEVTSGLGCDLCVIGRGHSSGNARIGGHAYAIIRDAVCPVVSI